jgi:hypothetical protein
MRCNAAALYSAQCNASDQHTHLDFGEAAALAVFPFVVFTAIAMSLIGTSLRSLRRKTL